MYDSEREGGERARPKMAIPIRLGRRQRGERFLQRQFGGHGGGFLHRFRLRFSSQRLFRTIIISLVFIAVVPPIFFHFRLRNFHQVCQFLHLLKPIKISIFVNISLNRIWITGNEWMNERFAFCNVCTRRCNKESAVGWMILRLYVLTEVTRLRPSPTR